jgi:uncharacterized membrane protein
LEVSEHSGPIPTPEILQGYENVVPGAGERILRMAEQQAEHRRSLEAKVVTSNIHSERIGQVFALAVASGFLWVGYSLIQQGRDVGWLAVIMGPLLQLVTVFVNGRQRRAPRPSGD